MTATARKATFDASDQHRRSLLAKVHIAKKQLRLSDDDYVAILIDIVKCDSAAKCSQAQLEKLVRAFEAKGFKATARASGRRGNPAVADHPAARKARAMWISLYLLKAIEDPSERALEAFARRQLGCDKLQWANQSLVYRLVEGLKAIAERHGWDQSVAGLPSNAVAINLKRRLCIAILAKLKAADLIPQHWDVDTAAFSLAGVEVQLIFASAETLDLVARSLGAVLAGRK
ncbi:regulatory protein GemA [Sphingomonas sp. Marseille-Q8236]|jgi:phage gp16-like protein